MLKTKHKVKINKILSSDKQTYFGCWLLLQSSMVAGVWMVGGGGLALLSSPLGAIVNLMVTGIGLMGMDKSFIRHSIIITRQNIKSLIQWQILSLFADLDKEENSLLVQTRPWKNKNQSILFAKFFGETISNNFFSRKRIEKIEKTYPGLLKETIEEFIDAGIIEHLSLKCKMNDERWDYKLSALFEYIVNNINYKIDNQKINNFSSEKILKIQKFIDFNNKKNIDLIIAHGDDDVLNFIKDHIEQQKNEEILTELINNQSKNKTIKKETKLKQPDLQGIIKDINSDILKEKFELLNYQYAIVNEKLKDGVGVDEIDKKIWVENVFNKLTPSLIAYRDLLKIKGGQKSELLIKAVASIEEQFDIINSHLEKINIDIDEKNSKEKHKTIIIQDKIIKNTIN